MKHICILLLVFSPIISISQEEIGEYLKWSAVRKLTWADYKASPDTDSDAAASTTTSLSIEYNISSSGFGYKIKSRFSKTNSWVLHKTDYILSHEQGHFDLAEVFARKLHKQMNEYIFNKRTYQKDLDKIYKIITEEKTKMQDNYDRETRHSINREKQAEWLKKIKHMLEEYQAWAHY
ncbi:MAG: DUF922 domain-containing protein [Chitinophagaceae bacterium]|nr:DUF922 domain-containing protein [Chitinophagaceae bacterium]MBK8953042.1 DUF922 domain-containing protein [Chitinophagaceae bacterium]